MNLFRDVLSNIKPLDKTSMEKVSERLDKLIKPIGSFGKLEKIAIQVAGITGKLYNKFDKKCTIVMSADNGVCQEGVSSCPQYITYMQTINFLKNMCGINALSNYAGSDIRVVDIGIDKEIYYPGLIINKIKMGTENMAKGPAMTREEAIKAIEVGIEVVKDLVKEGYCILGTGEMGVGNTSTSSALLMSFTGCSSKVAVGKGAGLVKEDFINKKKIIETALRVNQPNPKDPIDVLSKVGGLDIAGLVGCFIGAAYLKVPIVIDGFISSAAALTAYKLNPLTREYMIPSHNSEEPGFKLIMKELNMEPFLNLGMRLGEGTGCPLAFNIVESACRIVSDMATFEEAALKDDYLIDIR